MTGGRVLAIPIVCAGLGLSMLHAGDFSSYRGMQFGMNLSTAAKQAGTSPSEARTVHPWPAVIQEIALHERLSSFASYSERNGLLWSVTYMRRLHPRAVR